MASLDKRGKNSYRIRWIENGVRMSDTIYTDSYQDAIKVRIQKEEELQRAKNSKLKMNELWMLYKRARPRRGDKKHEEAYWERAIEFFGDCYIHQITRNSLNDYKNYLLKQLNKNYKNKKVLLSSSYVLTCLKRLQTVLNYGRQEGIIEYDVFIGFKFPHDRKREFVLSKFEFEFLYETTKKENPLYALFIKLLIQTGWRRSELYNLKWSDIGDKHIILRTTKSFGDNQTYPAFGFIKKTLGEIYNLQSIHFEYVWSNINGKRLQKGTISRMVSRYMKKAGFSEGVAHTLRHSFATNSQANGLTIYEANLLLRQSSIKMTERYSHLIPDSIDERKVDFLNPYNQVIQLNGINHQLKPMTNIFEQVR